MNSIWAKVIIVAGLGLCVLLSVSSTEAAVHYAAQRQDSKFYVDDATLSSDDSFLRADVIAKDENGKILNKYTVYYCEVGKNITVCKTRSSNPKHGAKVITEGTFDWQVYKKASELWYAKSSKDNLVPLLNDDGIISYIIRDSIQGHKKSFDVDVISKQGQKTVGFCSFSFYTTERGLEAIVNVANGKTVRTLVNDGTPEGHLAYVVYVKCCELMKQ